jgi:hypothetical protein
MNFYKILHIPSGLYYKPSRDTTDLNVSKIGKVYNRRPSIAQYEGTTVRLGFGKVGKTYHFSNSRSSVILCKWDQKDWKLQLFTSLSQDIPWS